MQVKVSEKEISAYYESALTKEPQMLINFLIRETIVFDNEIHIYFNNPLQTGPDASQGLSVCDRETTIQAHIQNSYELNGRIYGLLSPSENDTKKKKNNLNRIIRFRLSVVSRSKPILNRKPPFDASIIPYCRHITKRADLSDRFLCRADRLYEFSAILFPQ